MFFLTPQGQTTKRRSASLSGGASFGIALWIAFLLFAASCFACLKWLPVQIPLRMGLPGGVSFCRPEFLFGDAHFLSQMAFGLSAAFLAFSAGGRSAVFVSAPRTAGSTSRDGARIRRRALFSRRERVVFSCGTGTSFRSQFLS